MKRLVWLLMAALLLLTACTPRVWYRPGATSEMRDRDLRLCRYQAEQAFAAQTPPLREFRVYVDVPLDAPAELALSVRQAAEEGVRRAYWNYRDGFIDDYVDRCMRRKGYVLVEQD